MSSDTSSRELIECYNCGHVDSSLFMYGCVGCFEMYCHNCMDPDQSYCERCNSSSDSDTSSEGYTGCKNCGPTTPVGFQYYKCSRCFEMYCSMCMCKLQRYCKAENRVCRECYDDSSDSD